MSNTGTDFALGDSPAHTLRAGVEFCAAPDPLLDLRAPQFFPNLYSFSFDMCLAAERLARASRTRMISCEDPAYSRAYRNHPSNFGKNAQ